MVRNVSVWDIQLQERVPLIFALYRRATYEEAPAAWTLYAYTIPKEARYVCINCVSHEAFMFMLDDLFVGTNQIRPKAQPMAEVR